MPFFGPNFANYSKNTDEVARRRWSCDRAANVGPHCGKYVKKGQDEISVALVTRERVRKEVLRHSAQ